MKKETFKRRIRKITAFAAAVAMAATFTFPAEVGDGLFGGFGNAIVASAEAVISGKYIYEVNAGNETVTIYGYSSLIGDVELPGTIDGKTVTSIGDNAFFMNSDLTSITIPDSVTSIGKGAFASCGKLASISIPNSVISIGEYAFNNSDSLASITIPDSVTSIGVYAFLCCTSLTSIFLPESLSDSNIGSTSIPETATQVKYSVSDDNKVTITSITLGTDQTSVTIPDTIGGKAVTSIGNSAFSGCTNLESIFIPDSVTSIGTDAIPTSATQIRYTVSGDDITITGATLGSDQTSVVIPEKIGGKAVTAIGDHAFYRFKSLASITIPDSVVSIENYAFSNCTSLASVSFGDNSQLTSIGDYAFFVCTSLSSVSFGDNSQLTSIGDSAFSVCTSLASVSFGDNSQLTSIGDSAFYSCSNLKSIKFPESVQSIGIEAFSSCGNLESITIPESVTSIGNSAFLECSNLKTIYLPESASVGTDAIPDSTSQIKYTVDNDGNVTITDVNLKGQTSVTIPDTIDGKTVKAVYINDEITGVNVPESVTKVSYTVDANGNITIKKATLGSGQTSVVIPEKIGGKAVTAIGDSAFGSCSSLASITIPDSVVSIENYAFNNCTSLATVSFGENPQLTSIRDNAFNRCSNLKSIKFPESVQSIGNCAFESCGSLESVTIPKNVSSIGQDAFISCSSINVVENNPNYSSDNGVLFDKNKTKLIRYPANKSGTSYVVPDSVKLIDKYAFAACRELTSVTIPEGVTSIGDLAFSHCLSLKSITIPNSVKSIGNYAFTDESDYGYYIESIFLPNSLTSIGTDAIYGATTTVRYTVDDEGNAAIVNIELGENQTNIDIPKKIGEYPVIAAAEEYQQFVGEHTHTGGSATCTEKPVCSICGNTYGEVDPDNHSFTNYVSDDNATCTENGTETAKCDRCDKTDTREEVGSALSHDHSGDWQNDTDDHWRVCARDNCTEILDKASHDFDEGVITTQPTEDAEGVKTYTCEICGYEKTEAIPVTEPSIPDDPAEKVNSFVERLYENVLGRPSDPSKESHIDNLNNGETATKVAYDFVFSPEFTELDISNEERVTIMYNTFLNRDPDPAGLETWTKALDNGCSIGHIFYGFTQSGEFGEICDAYGIEQGTWECTENRDRSSKLTAFVSRLYTKAMGRAYDVNGLNDHTGNYLENRDLYQLAYNFIFSPEFIEKNLSDEDFVDVMYRTFFDREADPAGKADWLDRMANQGYTREDVLAGFVGSQECIDLVARFGI